VRGCKHIDFDDTITITIVSHVSGIRIYISTGPDCRYDSIPNCFVSRLAGLINNLFGFILPPSSIPRMIYSPWALLDLPFHFYRS